MKVLQALAQKDPIDIHSPMIYTSLGQFPTALASRLSAEMTSGCLGKLYEQIDPLRVAEVHRALLIARNYASKIGTNLKEGALEKLLMHYRSHDSVIDPDEAEELFEKISQPHERLEELGKVLKNIADQHLDGSNARVTYLPEKPHEDATQQDSEPTSKGIANCT